MSVTGARREIMNAAEIAQALERLAERIVQRDPVGELSLVGIRSRGATLALRLQALLKTITDVDIPLGILDIGLYRDDIGLKPVAPNVRSTDIPFDVEGKDIVLVDDVLFTGRTVRGALNALIDMGRPNRVQLLVLIDRGHRELPIQADYVGQEVKIGPREKIVVRLREEDEEEGVFVRLDT